MAKIMEVYVHVEGSREPKLAKVSEDATLKEVAAAAGCSLNEADDIFIGRQDDDNAFHHGDSLDKAKVKHRQHIHCHRCKKIQVSVLYNGQKERDFSPAIRLDVILRWAIREFNLEGQDAADMALFLPGEQSPLDGDIHIGSLASFPECSVTLAMNAPALVNG